MPSALKLLLVDDNPMVLAMLRQALAGLANITTASDGGDALLKAIDDPPDLIVSDYRMPGMDGRQLLEKLRSRAATERVPVVLFASKADINEKLKSVQDLLEDLVEKPFFLKDATARVKRVLDKIVLEKLTREAPGQSVVRGSLAQMNVIDLLQSLELGRKSCSLTLATNSERCEMYFSEGQIHHAVCGNLRGDSAVYRVVGWPGGSFEINFVARSFEHSTTRSTQSLLMEGLRLLDEARRDAEENVLDT
jgi:CheY-like chemotaxis protein